MIFWLIAEFGNVPRAAVPQELQLIVVAELVLRVVMYSIEHYCIKTGLRECCRSQRGVAEWVDLSRVLIQIEPKQAFRSYLPGDIWFDLEMVPQIFMPHCELIDDLVVMRVCFVVLDPSTFTIDNLALLYFLSIMSLPPTNSNCLFSTNFATFARTSAG